MTDETTTPRRRSARRSVVAFVLGSVLLVTGAGMLAGASASDPEEQTVRLGAEPGFTKYTWTGVIPAGATGLAGNAGASCINFPDFEDEHILNIEHAKPRLYREVNIELKVVIAWENGPIVNDNAMTVYGPDGGEIDSSDGGEPFESVSFTNADEGEYSVVACGFANATDTPYEGRLEVNITKRRTAPARSTALPAQPSGGSSLPFAPNAPANTIPQVTPAPGAGRIAAPLFAPTTVPVSEAAPTAFQGFDDIAQDAPEPVETIAVNTTEIPWWIAIVVILLGIASGGFGLFERRRRHLDVPPTVMG